MSDISQAQHWLKTVVMGQPIHRDNLGEEDESNGTLRGVSPTVLKLAPQLQQTMTQELNNAPRYEGPAKSVPGMSPGGNMVSGPRGVQNRSPKPPTNTDGTKD